MNPCIKTGCDVLIQSHQAVLHGDLYLCGEIFVLRYCQAGIEPHWSYNEDRISEAKAQFENTLCDEVCNGTPWLPPDNLQLEWAGVWLTHRDYVRLNPELTALLADQEAYRKHLENDDE